MLLAATYAEGAEPNTGKDGTQWLGFRGDGTSSSNVAPATLVMGDGGNLAWKRGMPGRSVAGPIVVGDLVVSTSSSGQNGEVLHVDGVDLTSGELAWRQVFRATGRPYCHPTSANAAPTPASDGQRIFAFFSSNDLVCLSAEGKLLWYRGLGYDYPKAGNDIGMASSPLCVDGAVIVQVEAQGDSFAAAIDVETGKNLWRLDRPKRSNWSSPLAIRRGDGSSEVIIQSRQDVIAVDPRSGKTLWRTDEAGASVSSPTASGGTLLLPGNSLIALDVSGDEAMPPVVWRNNRLVPRNASVVAAGDRIYCLKGSVLVAAEIDRGRLVWQKRLSGLAGTWATPVIADQTLYVFDQVGLGLVVRDNGKKAEIVSKVQLGEPVLASPAAAAGRLLVRGERTIFCFK
jgi:outer membrane protein assembly factor BamB